MYLRQLLRQLEAYNSNTNKYSTKSNIFYRGYKSYCMNHLDNVLSRKYY